MFAAKGKAVAAATSVVDRSGSSSSEDKDNDVDVDVDVAAPRNSATMDEEPSRVRLRELLKHPYPRKLKKNP
jgi:hypothetical protein